MSTDGPSRTSREGRPLRADARRNHDKILAAADVVFAQGGASATTEEVARRAGVAVGTVFTHFPTKQDLLIALMKQSLDQLAGHASELSHGPHPEHGLFAFLRLLADAARSRTTVLALLPGPIGDLAIASSSAVLTDAVATLLSYAQESETVRADVTTTDVLALMTALTHTSVSRTAPTQTHEHVLTVIIDGLRPPPSASS